MRAWKKCIKKVKNESGAAMIWALIIFMVVSVASMTIISIQHADIREIMTLENHLSAYYASVGGMEFGLAALMSSYGSSGTLFDYFVKDGVIQNTLKNYENTTYKHTYEYKEGGATVADAEIRIYKHPSSDGWIVVESIGTDKASGETATNYLRINVKNKAEVRRDGTTLANPGN